MLRCMDCGGVFDEDEAVYETVCWEDYYGVSGLFPNKNYGSVATCPHCGSEEFEDYWEDDEEVKQ